MALSLVPRGDDDLAEIVLLALERVEEVRLEVTDDGLVEVLDVAEEDGRERRVELGEELDPLALVDARVVPRRVSVEVACTTATAFRERKWLERKGVE